MNQNKNLNLSDLGNNVYLRLINSSSGASYIEFYGGSFYIRTNGMCFRSLCYQQVNI